MVTQYSYDANGNRTAKNNGTVSHTYSYDRENRLASVSDGSGTIFSAVYDYRTRRISKVENGSTTRYIYDGGVNVEEYAVDAQNQSSLTKVLVRGTGMGGGIGSVLYTEDSTGSNRSFFCYNAIGSTVALTDSTGTVTGATAYEAFGKVVSSTGNSSENRKFCTKERDSSTGLDNFGFRYFDWELGRFITRDPSGYPDGPNNYLYCHNNPINFIDPLGLASKDVDSDLVKQIQDIADEIQGLDIPNHLNPNNKKAIGSWRHKLFQKRIDKLKNPRLLTEKNIQKAGIIKGGRGAKRPDLIILKKGENAADVVKGSSINGMVDAIVDLKTGVDDIKPSWAEEVSKRLGMSFADIHSVGNGRNLAKSFESGGFIKKLAGASLRRNYGAIKNIAKGTLKVGTKALIIGGVLLAYSDAKARGMTHKAATAYAASSVVGGDLIYDVSEGIANTYWNTANELANNSPMGKHAFGLTKALHNNSRGGRTFDNNGKGLNAILTMQKTPTSGDIRSINNLK